jgi:hypothetical protein
MFYLRRVKRSIRVRAQWHGALVRQRKITLVSHYRHFLNILVTLSHSAWHLIAAARVVKKG